MENFELLDGKRLFYKRKTYILIDRIGYQIDVGKTLILDPKNGLKDEQTPRH